MLLKIDIKNDSSQPKFVQLYQQIATLITQGELKEGAILPSINELSFEFEISRDTAEKAYKELLQRGLVISVRGKGYFVNQKSQQALQHIFLLFNKLSPHKKLIYDAFIEQLQNKATTYLAIHHNNIQLFENQIIDSLGKYAYYVVIPPDDETEKVEKLIRKLPKNRVLILDRKMDDFDKIANIYQDFERDIVVALQGNIDLIKKYRKLSLVFPKSKGYAKEVMAGFSQFCFSNKFEFEIISEISENKVNEGKLFIVIEDEDLVSLIKICKQKQYQLSKEIGLIAYNDSPLKEILADGITVITTDFKLMGQRAAQIFESQTNERLANPFKIILRKSL